MGFITRRQYLLFFTIILLIRKEIETGALRREQTKKLIAIF